MSPVANRLGSRPIAATQDARIQQRARTALTTSRTPGHILESLQAATKSKTMRVDGQFRIVGPEEANGDHDGRS